MKHSRNMIRILGHFCDLGLAFLHQNNVVHLDFSKENIKIFQKNIYNLNSFASSSNSFLNPSPRKLPSQQNILRAEGIGGGGGGGDQTPGIELSYSEGIKKYIFLQNVRQICLFCCDF